MKNKFKILSMIFIFLMLSIPTQAGQEFWGSITSNKYHYPTCEWAKKISSDNLIKFNSAEEAVKDGYEPCPVCHPPLASKSEKETTSPVNVEANPAEISEVKNVLFLTCESHDYPTNSLFINAVKSKLK
jgi:methylphosphotriester-DNA--protein-cysteine methyltransferase